MRNYWLDDWLLELKAERDYLLFSSPAVHPQDGVIVVRFVVPLRWICLSSFDALLSKNGAPFRYSVHPDYRLVACDGYSAQIEISFADE